ncbi:hypothetical protein ACFL7D_04225 [candidate division KSB1 bacterium]
MKKSLIYFTAFLILLPLSLYGQIKTNTNNGSKGKQEYNQSNIGLIQAQFEARMLSMIDRVHNPLQSVPRPGINPDGFNQRGIFNASIFQNSFGFSSFYNHRLQQNLYLVGEVGYFFTSSNRANDSFYDRILGFNNNDFYEASIFPVYAGLRKGFTITNMFKRFYPYIGVGGGPAVGMGYIRNGSSTTRNFDYAPSYYTVIGSEIFTNNKLFFDISIRYRYLVFNDYLANWKDFSGVSFNFGFGYGIGTQILR